MTIKELQKLSPYKIVPVMDDASGVQWYAIISKSDRGEGEEVVRTAGMIEAVDAWRGLTLLDIARTIQ